CTVRIAAMSVAGLSDPLATAARFAARLNSFAATQPSASAGPGGLSEYAAIAAWNSSIAGVDAPANGNVGTPSATLESPGRVTVSGNAEIESATYCGLNPWRSQDRTKRASV